MMTVTRALPATTSYAVGFGVSSFTAPPTHLSSRQFVIVKASTEPSDKSVEIMRKFSEQYARKSGTYFCVDKSVTSVVIKVLLLSIVFSCETIKVNQIGSCLRTRKSCGSEQLLICRKSILFGSALEAAGSGPGDIASAWSALEAAGSGPGDIASAWSALEAAGSGPGDITSAWSAIKAARSGV
ncbi:hypothetical protein SSX86_030340 [Deinandra increscens subsp. villosa]|uniref:Ferredoxin-thioredoxin reductase catalytic chain, chloroplastic n=1 Tax=Deinandra increscens subsp. villosa TaxID=3103831 RepID=A0AAP0CB12_9ASTR